MVYSLLLCLLLVQLGWGAAGASRDPPGRLEPQRERTLRGKQHGHQSARASDSSSPWSRSTDGTILAQKLSEEVPTDVASYLYTGDSHELKRTNCSGRFELAAGLPGKSPTMVSLHPSLHGAMDTLIYATNFLNMINKSLEQNLQDDLEWYQALIRSIFEDEPSISRAAITFSTESLSSPAPQVFLQATRGESRILLQNLSSSAHHLANATQETEWFHGLRRKWRPHFHHRGSSQRGRSLSHSWRVRDGSWGEKNQVRWSLPYLECENGSYKPGWLVTLSAAFYRFQSNVVPEFRGVMQVDINLQKVDIDQCSGDGWFSGTHKCHLNNSECIPIKGLGFVLGAYKCNCKAGFYHPRVFSVNSFQNHHFAGDEKLEEVHICLPCKEGCSFCADDRPCSAQEDKYLRLAIISFQILCMLLDFISMLVVYHFRKAKSIRASGLILLETILFGSLLLYFPVIILYFEPSTFRCILLRWVRLLGFATVYGTVTLKLHRVLKVFLSRTAQRIPYMTGGRVMRMLAVILLIVFWFLIGWTSAVSQNLERHISITGQGRTSDHLTFNMCLIDRWDYMTAIAEFLFLLWGVYLCYAVRTVPSAFHEPRYMAVAVHNELIISAIFHTIRFVLASKLQSDWMLMLFFAHTHLTVTVTIGLLLIPKFSHSSNNPRDDIATEAYEDELDMGRSGSYLNSSINSAWSEHSLDPEDIRDELKKLYAQLEIYKRKKMITNNPHLQKKRCSKKGLGRSIMRRITEIPETVSRQCSKEDKEIMDHNATKNAVIMRKNPQESSSGTMKAKEESLKNRVFSLKKSHSTYDHVRDQSEESNSIPTENEAETTENSLLDSLASKKISKRVPENMEASSTESVPLVCKSASAHNLSSEKKPGHPRTSVLQKSLSVITSAKEKTLSLAGKPSIQGLEDNDKSPKPLFKGKEFNRKHSNPDKTETKDSARKNSTHSEEPRKLPKSGIMKQHRVSAPATNSETGSALLKDNFDIGEVCPWEVYDLTPGSVPSESKVQKHVSIVASETEKNTLPHPKEKSQHKPKSNEDYQQSNQKSVDKAEVCPWEVPEQYLFEEEKQHLNAKTQILPGSGKGENGSQLPSAKVCVGKYDELPSKIVASKAEQENTNQIGDQKKTLSSSEGNVLSSASFNSSNNFQQPLTSRAEVCPWEYETPGLPNAEKSVTLLASSALSANKTPTSRK
ncbi:metabotropic glycine receptor [Macrotis lagotis]|uniref:metabotropic glycine receptor n=1 Tax=Macrotis lagotis TaxID=92651 RepID=UPI003D68A637